MRLVSLTFALLLIGTACDEVTVGAPTALPEDFGYGTLTMDGQAAEGTRPVLLVIADYADTELRPGHGRDDAEEKLFGAYPNVADFFNENSKGVFGIELGGVAFASHPETLACAHGLAECDVVPAGANPEQARQDLLQIALDSGEVDVSVFDANGDGVVRQSELMVVFYEALPLEVATGGVTRSMPDTCVVSEAQEVSYCGQICSVGEGTGLATIAHEMSHLLGANDLYGAGFALNQNATLMGATIILDEEDVHELFHLDPWHKLVLGWSYPFVVSPEPDGDAARDTLRAASDSSGYRPILMYDVDHGEDEFFLLEMRAGLDGTYDRDVSDDGIAAWYVQRDSYGWPLTIEADGGREGDDRTVWSAGAPDQRRGGTTFWDDSHGDIELLWRDGSSSNMTVTIDEVLADQARVTVRGL